MTHQGEKVPVRADVLDVSKPFDVVVVGGGSAGLAAAAAAKESGAPRVLLLEREAYLGGVLPQCVHDGFGLYLYGESLTGPEYAQRWAARVRADGVLAALATTVLEVRPPVEEGLFCIDALGASLGGRACVYARSVVCATGCRERTRGALRIPGGRPAGVLTAGSAQYMVNVANQLPGDKVVILGSGDIGLIMARRMALEGAEVRLVLGQEATGLVRNHIRCIQDFDIPIRYGWGLVSVHGYGQLQGVMVAPLWADGMFDLARKEYVRCNVLLVACGLIPEREVLAACGDLSEVPGLFVCGNANVPHDLVDQVTQEGIDAGLASARYATGAVWARPIGVSGVVAEGLDASRTSTSCVLPSDLAHMASLAVQESRGKMAEVCEELPQGAQRIVCTVCPSGCVMVAYIDGTVAGNTCARGVEYALRERVCPTRIFTGTVALKGATSPLVAVRTVAAVPKDRLFDLARLCHRLVVEAPVRVGDVVCRNAAGTGVDIVATDERVRSTEGAEVCFGSEGSAHGAF